MTDAIGVALTGLAGMVATGLIGLYKVRMEQHKVTQAELEMRFQRAALSFPDFVEEWSEIHADVLTLMEETCIDRFLILRAWNGYLEPRWTTAMFQVRTSGQTPIAYVHFELDRDYVERLRALTKRSNVYVITEDLDNDSALKAVYENEGVTAAFLSHLLTLKGPIEGTQSHTYCSFATHDPAGIPLHVQTQCKILVSRMKGMAAGFEERAI